MQKSGFTADNEKLEFPNNNNNNNKNGNIKEQTALHTIEEAIEVTGKGKFHYWLLFVTGGCLMSVINETLGISFIIPASKNDLTFTIFEQGALNSTGFLGIVLSSHLWGFLSDTWGRYKVLRFSLFGAFTFSIISSISISIWMLIITRFCVGFLIAGCAATGYAYLGEFHGEKTRSQAIAFAALFMSFSLVYLPAICWVVIPLDISFNIDFLGIVFSSWRLNIVLSALITGITALALLPLPESPKFLLTQGKHDEAMDVLRKVYRWNNNLSEETYPIKSVINENSDEESMKNKGSKEIALLMYNQTMPLFKKPHLWKTLASFFIMFSLFAGSSGFYMWVPQLTIDMTPYKNTTITVCQVIAETILTKANQTENSVETPATDINTYSYQILVIMGMVFGVNYLIIGFTIKRCGKRSLLMFWLIIAGLCGIALIWANNFYLIFVLMVGFLSSGNCCSVVAAMAVDLFPTNIRAMALCLILMIGRLGAATGSYIVGVLLIKACYMNFVFLGGVQIISAIIAFFLGRQLLSEVKTDV